MKFRIVFVLEGVGAALLVLLPYYCKFLDLSNITIYHLHLPATNLIGGILVDLLFYSILTTAFLVVVQYLFPLMRIFFEGIFAGTMLWFLVDFINLSLIHMEHHQFTDWAYLWWHGGLPILLLSGVLSSFFPLATQSSVRVVRFVLAAFGFSVFWIVPQLLFVAITCRPIHAANQMPDLINNGSNKRIIWILFDELSYRQVFEHRAPDVQLPNFDQVRGESVSFSNLKPAGFYTELIIPSLFLGQRLDQIRSTTHGELWYRNKDQGRWLTYDPNLTLLGLAKKNGWNTGIDGWFNPYCRIFASVVNTCSWEPNEEMIERAGASEENSVLANAILMPNRLLEPFRKTTTPEEDRIQIYRRIMVHAQTLIEDNKLQFIFLHIPAPHGPGIYDRKSHTLKSGGTYLDRLVLADDTLGTLVKEIDASATASHTTVIVSSDHSWRVYAYGHAALLSDEEVRASERRFDDRPVLMIHFPNQSKCENIQSPSSEMFEHDIIAGMLRGRINAQEDLMEFLSQHGH